MLRRTFIATALCFAIGSFVTPVHADGAEGKASAIKRAPLKAPRTPGTRAPLERDYDLKTTKLSFEEYHQTAKVVRHRTEGKRYATFFAEPQLIDTGAAMIFEIRSVARTGSVSRWRCVAVNDVAECLGAPVRVRYLPADERIVLVARIAPRTSVAELGAVASR